MDTLRISRWISVVARCTLVFGFLASAGAASPTADVASPSSLSPQNSSLLFVENVGQFPEAARFLVYGSNQGRLWLAENALWVTVESEEQGQSAAIRLTFPGVTPHLRLEPFGLRETMFNYYRGNAPSHWHTKVPVWSGVRYVDLYPGVDLEITGEGNSWTWQLTPSPSQGEGWGGGAPSPSQGEGWGGGLRLRVEGAEGVTLTENYLHLSTAAGDLILPLISLSDGAPGEHSTIVETDRGIEVVSPFASAIRNPKLVLSEANGSKIQNPNDNADHLLYSTFLGGDSEDKAYAVTVNNVGEAYVTGYTETPGFPTTPGAYDSSFGGDSEIFVTRLNADGSDLIYSTFLGGTGVYTNSVSEWGWDIALDGEGAVYIAGESNSNDFPTTPGAYSPTYIPANPDDIFPGSPPAPDLVIVKLDASGTLVYGTYFAPTLGYGMGIAVDGSGVYVAGGVGASDFPTTEGAYHRSFGYSPDFFVLKLDLAAQGQSALLYSTYVAKSVATPTEPRGWEYFGDMALRNGVVYVVGSTDYEFPTTTGAYDPTFNGTLPCSNFPCPQNVVFFMLNPAGNGAADLLYSTYLGGSAGVGEQGYDVAVDAAGMVYLTGSTWVEDFPTTPGAFDTTYNGFGDAFVSKLNPAGNGAADLLYSTYLGGTWYDLVFDSPAIAMDGSGDIYVAGSTFSLDFPVTPGAYQSPYHGFFVTRLRPQGNGAADLIYGTNFGGQGPEYTGGIALGQGETVFVAGYTNASDFPTTAGAYDTTFGGGTCGSYSCNDAFVAKLRVKPSYVITGTVVDTEGQPILGVQVFAGEDYRGATNTRGEYTITDPEPGVYLLTPQRKGYFFSPQTRMVTIPPSAIGQDFVGIHILKESNPPSGARVEDGQALTYTVQIVFPDVQRMVLYDPIPADTVYISDTLIAPPGILYDPATSTITGTLDIPTGTPVSVTFAVRLEAPEDADFTQILNKACIYPENGAAADCVWSNEIRHYTGGGVIYLPVIMR